MESTQKEIQDQLERILLSDEFRASKRLADFLHFVVEETLAGRADQINQRTVGIKGLGYSSTINTQTNPAVRIHAHRLRRALDQYYSSQGIEDPIRIMIPKGGYIPIFNENQPAMKPPGRSPRTPDIRYQDKPAYSDPTIAIFTFENLDHTDENSYIAMGLTDEILVALTKFSPLQVKGPLSKSEDRPVDFSKIYRDYDARFVLQGRVRSQGSMVRITTDLTDASTIGKQWAVKFEYDLGETSLYEIEDQVTSQIAGAVADGLGIIFRRLQAETYQEHIKFNDVTQAVLSYNMAWTTQAPDDWGRAILLADQALASQPNNALLVALQANIYYADALHELNIVPGSREKMKPLALKAVSLDPNLQLAQYNLVVQNAFWGKAKECVEAAHKVVELNPNNARILAGCAVATTSVGAYELGSDLIERAKRLNPHYPGWYHFINFLVDYVCRDFEAAWKEAQKVHVEGLVWHPLIRAATLGQLGRTDEAHPFTEDLLTVKPDFLERPREIIRLLFVLEEHLELIIEGLRKAGLEVV